MSTDPNSTELDSFSTLTLAGSPKVSEASLLDSRISSYTDRLPVELLCRAFCWLPLFKDEEGGIALNARTPPWIPLIHTCSSWRTIAMECKELWSWIPLGHPKWTELALRLSEPVGIALRLPGDRLFASNDEAISSDDNHLKESFSLVLTHLSRVWNLEVTMRLESSNEEDGELYERYRRAREVLAPLRVARMDGLVNFYCVNADLRMSSFFEESWTSQVRHLRLGGCRMSKTLQLCHLPLVSLVIAIPFLEDTFADFLTLLGTLTSLEDLTVLDTLKPAYLTELFADATPLQDSRVTLPRVKEMVLMRSPLFMTFYLRYLDILTACRISVVWFACDYDIPDAILSDAYLPVRRPLWDDFGDLEITSNHRAAWLGGLCLELCKHVYGVVTDMQHVSRFDPTTFIHPKVRESDYRHSATMHAITWEPETSRLLAMWAEGTRVQPMIQGIFGVTSIVDYAEWESLFEILRERGARSQHARAYSTPAVFCCLFDDGSLGRKREADMPPLTLVALHPVDFTNPMLKPYFLAFRCLLLRSENEKGPIFDIHVLFPFGLKLSEDQRRDLMRYNLRVSEFVEDYTYPEFENTDT